MKSTKKYCVICRSEMVDTSNRQNRKYCSRKCIDRNQTLNGNKIKAKRKYDNSDKGRKRNLEYYYENKERILIRKKDRDKIKKQKDKIINCQRCGIEESLEIHHISYKPSKTILLCKCCHLNEHNKQKRGLKR